MKILLSSVLSVTCLLTCVISAIPDESSAETVKPKTKVEYENKDCLIFYEDISNVVVYQKEPQPVDNVIIKTDVVEETSEEIIEESVTLIETEIKPYTPYYYTGEQPYRTITYEERELLAKIVYLEAGICSQECQRAIASVIFNRLDSGFWASDMNNDGKITVYDMIYFPLAFSPANQIPYTTATEDCYAAVDYVVTYGPTLPTYVRYFRIDYDFDWANYKNYCVMDNVHFGYVTTWVDGVW